MRFLLLPLLLTVSACATPPSGGSDPAAYAGSDSSASLTSLEEGDRRAAAEEQEMLDALARRGIYPETRPCQVTVKYHNSGQTIGLYNESYIDRSDYYSQAKRSADYKVVADIEMGALLKQLDEFGYFERADPGVVRRGGVTMSLLVRRGTDAWTVHLPRYVGDPKDEKRLAEHRERQEFSYECADAVRAIYNTTRALQLIENELGAEYFDKEAERIREANARSRGGSGDGR